MYCKILKSAINYLKKIIMIKVNMISESEFTIKWHWVHTAFVELLNALEKKSEIKLEKNWKNKANIIHIHTVWPYSFIKLFFSWWKKVVSAHVIPESFIGSIKWAKYWLPLAKYRLKIFYKKADMVLACSRNVKISLESDLKIKNVKTFYNSIDMSKYYFSEDEKKSIRNFYNYKKNDFIVIWNWQIQPRKRFDTFIEVAKSLPDIKFIWIWGIPFKNLWAQYKNMKKLINSIPKNMKITWVITLDEVKDYYAIANVFFLPSDQENHPMAVLEASWSSLPIILRDIKEYEDTFSWLSLFWKNKNEFIEIIKKLKENKDFYEKAIINSKKISQKFDSNNKVNELIEIYKEILAN